MRKLYLILTLIFFSNVLLAQSGKITGTVLDEKSGNPLSKATLLIEGLNRSVITDQNGNFSFSNLTAGKYNIQCSYISYKTKIIEDVVVTANDITTIKISLLENRNNNKGEVVTVTAATRVKAAGENNLSLIAIQKRDPAVMDFVTAQTLKSTPAKTVSDAVKLVSGASIQDDRFAVIRGLNDRYNAAFINGAPLPSTESDRKAFAFDLFPSAILDNLIIYKTATPDKTGDFAGGVIDISTKAAVPKNFTSISYGLGINNLATGNNRFFSENKGKKDWIGLDDGTRRLNPAVPEGYILTFASFTQRAEYSKLFNKFKWGVQQGNTLPNFNFQFTKGISVPIKEKEFLGALFSVNYYRSYSFVDTDRDVFNDINNTLIQSVEMRDSVYNDEVIVSLLGNLSFKINNKNSISIKNNLSINSDNKLIKRLFVQDLQNAPNDGIRETVRSFTSNKAASSQLLGEHLIGNKNTKINWLASYTDVLREIPNFARSAYQISMQDQNEVGNHYVDFNASQLVGSGTMFFATTKETLKSFKLDISQPYKFFNNTQNVFKIGAGYLLRDRTFRSNLMGFVIDNISNFDVSLNSLPIEQAFLPQNLGFLANGKRGYVLKQGVSGGGFYNATSATTHAYIMNDQRFLKNFRLIYGIRMEQFDQNLTSIYDSTVTDFLPSLNLVYALNPKTNVRLSYSNTVNRPEFREFAPFVFYNYELQYSINGDPKLKRAKIKNYDFRIEFFPGKAQVFSISTFYKEFKNPIEVIFIPTLTQQAIYSNAKSATNLGVEAEFRTQLSTLFGVKKENSLLSKFTLSANAAYIKTEAKVDTAVVFGNFVADRPLQGQSPYIVNGSLGFNDEKLGLTSTISFNRIGDRLFIAGSDVGSIYEKARTVIDFQIAKYFMKNAIELKLNVKDILAQNLSFYYDLDKSKNYTNKDIYFSKSKMPTTVSFTATLKF